MKKLLALLLAVLMLFALAACGEKDDDDDKKSGGKNDNSYMKVVEDFVQGYFGVDPSKLDNAAPAGYMDEMLLEEAKRNAELNYENMEYMMGGDFTIAVKNAKTAELSKDAKKAIIEAFKEYDINAEDVMMLNADLEIKSESKTETEPGDVKLVKVGGKWYVAEWYEYEGMYYEPGFMVGTMIGG